MSKTAISVEDIRSSAIEALAAFCAREYLDREPVSRLLAGLAARRIDLPAPTVKTCRGCLNTKPLDDFPHIDSCECSRCAASASRSTPAYMRRYRAEHRETSRSYNRDWMRRYREAQRLSVWRTI